jgi:16S rRNA U1498 N3-methylase RsmE
MVNGPKGSGEIMIAREGFVEIKCSFDGNLPPQPPLNLILAMPRPKVMKRLWAQLSAVGVNQIVIINAERIEKNYFDTHILKEDFYQQLLI